MNLPEFLVDHPDGEIRLAGSRIGLYHVIFFHRRDFTPEMLHEQFPTLSVPLLRQVLTFYRENQAEVDDYVDRYQAEIDDLRASAPKGPSLEELRRRLEARRQAEPR